MRNGETTLELPFGDKQSSPLGAQMDAGAVACIWRELPQRRVELVVVVNGAELRSGACRYHMDALAKVKRMRQRAHREGG